MYFVLLSSHPHPSTHIKFLPCFLKKHNSVWSTVDYINTKDTNLQEFPHFARMVHGV